MIVIEGAGQPAQSPEDNVNINHITVKEVREWMFLL